MSKLKITLACWDYDRTRALMDGTVRPAGIDLNYLNLPVEETFFRMLRHREFDAAEMSLSSYAVSLFTEDRPFVAIPVFPSRFFRHSSIYINVESGIREPGDLVGKRIGTPEYQMTAPVWIRGILADEYSVPVTSVQYLTGGEESPDRPEKLELNLPEEISVTPIGTGKTLNAMLESGEIQALYTARAPSSFYKEGSGIRRLFEQYPQEERNYYRKTGIFPIMHCVVIRRDIYEKYPWVAQSLFKAFVESKKMVYEDLRETAALKVMLPWLMSHLDETVSEMGADFWAYGYAQNRKAIETFLRYHHEQGLSPQLLKPEDLFVPESMESFVI
jgi:4,5-dihydroxyphthalate decarboxylase